MYCDNRNNMCIIFLTTVSIINVERCVKISLLVTYWRHIFSIRWKLELIMFSLASPANFASNLQYTTCVSSIIRLCFNDFQIIILLHYLSRWLGFWCVSFFRYAYSKFTFKVNNRMRDWNLTTWFQTFLDGLLVRTKTFSL